MPMKADAAQASVSAEPPVVAVSMKKRMICGLTTCKPALPSSSTTKRM